MEDCKRVSSSHQSPRGDRPYSVAFAPVTDGIVGRVRVPGSKSITNRALICAAMAEGTSVLRGALESEDTIVMVDAWRQLGVAIDWDRDAAVISVRGCGGQPNSPHGKLFVANSGTSIRFLTAALAATKGEYTLDGVPRMRERPIGDLIQGLKDWGADVESHNRERPDCPPVHLRASGLAGGVAVVRGAVSSQFLSGMMMAAPYCREPVRLEVEGGLVSKPYVAMTARVMESFGVRVLEEAENTYQISAPQRYQGIEYAIEPDASAASYFLAASAITGGRVRVEGLSMDALQGDVNFAKVLARMGCVLRSGDDYIEVEGQASQGIDVDMNSISDTVQTLAAVAVFAKSPTRVRGVAHNRHKETDRIGDLARELRKLGATVDEHEDGLTIHPQVLKPATLETYRDHRMAMSFSLIAMCVSGTRILDPRCTEKTYPGFFEDFGQLIGKIPEYGYESGDSMKKGT